jgi:hypothetical protein
MKMFQRRDSERPFMTFPKARLVVSACLFLAWLGFLLYLVIDSRKVVLSKPQFLVAQLYAIIEATAGNPGDVHPDATVTVTQVLWSAHDADRKLEKQVLRLPDLAECTKEHGYLGAGKYLLPLIESSDGWMIASLPRFVYRAPHPTHGTVEAFGIFSHRVARRRPIADARKLKEEWVEAGYRVQLVEEELRLYRWCSDTQAQVSELIAAKNK